MTEDRYHGPYNERAIGRADKALSKAQDDLSEVLTHGMKNKTPIQYDRANEAYELIEKARHALARTRARRSTR